MNAQNNDDTRNPDQFVSKDVSELRHDFGRLDERIIGLEKTMATKEHLANWRAQGLRTALNILIPIFAATISALAIILTGVAKGSPLT